MQHQLACWRCGESLAALSLPLSRMDECPACAMSLHVCRMCRHYDRRVADQCRNDEAEFVKEKERPNFCDYFDPSENAYDPGDDQADAAREQLESLFGSSSSDTPDDSHSALDSLFRKD